jgi:hypothetical protein
VYNRVIAEHPAVRCTLWFKTISRRTYSPLALVHLAETIFWAARLLYIADRSSFTFFFLFSIFINSADAAITIRVLYLTLLFFLLRLRFEHGV